MQFNARYMKMFTIGFGNVCPITARLRDPAGRPIDRRKLRYDRAELPTSIAAIGAIVTKLIPSGNGVCLLA